MIATQPIAISRQIISSFVTHTTLLGLCFVRSTVLRVFTISFTSVLNSHVGSQNVSRKRFVTLWIGVYQFQYSLVARCAWQHVLSAWHVEFNSCYTFLLQVFKVQQWNGSPAKCNRFKERPEAASFSRGSGPPLRIASLRPELRGTQSHRFVRSEVCPPQRTRARKLTGDEHGCARSELLSIISNSDDKFRAAWATYYVHMEVWTYIVIIKCLWMFVERCAYVRCAMLGDSHVAVASACSAR